MATGAAAVAGRPDPADAAGYPRLRVVALDALSINRPVRFNYPLRTQPNVLLDFGAPTPQGVGPQRSIVAFSTLCQHMGCAVEYEAGRRELVCPCHQSRYDPERLASIVSGVATRALPRVVLEVRDGAVFAVGMRGLIYGYRKNLSPGRKVGS